MQRMGPASPLRIRTLSRAVLFTALACALALSRRVRAAPVPAQPCPGDCDQDDIVRVDELVHSIRIALGLAPADSCVSLDVNADGAVEIDEIVTAVAASLGGCPGARTESPAPTFTATPASPTVTPTPPETCGNGIAENFEQCDDGNRTNGDGCSASCTLEDGGDICAGIPTRSGEKLDAVLVAGGLSMPLYVIAPPRDPSRIFIVQQGGRIRIVQWGQLLSKPFLDLSSKVVASGERGMLSLAFHPDYAHNGIFFVDYTTAVPTEDGSGQLISQVSKFHVSADPNVADASSEETVLRQNQPFVAHNGGLLLFGPDHYLYVFFGDGGVTARSQNNAQDPSTWLGKVLRIDVDSDTPYAIPPDNPFVGPDGILDEIWLMGLRNPWRGSFDPFTGQLYLGDVGEGSYEEIDIAPPPPQSRNFGWCCYEANHAFPSCYDAVNTCAGGDFTPPVLEYPHSDGVSVTGGYVYAGCAMPDLRGTYFYGDYGKAFVRSFRFDGKSVHDEKDWTTDLAEGTTRTIDYVSSFGTDARGELYIADLTGEVFKIVPDQGNIGVEGASR
jgi:cysteine-rich repeat protein